MKEAIKKILNLETVCQEDMETARKQADEVVARAKKEAQEMEAMYRCALDEKKKADRENQLKELEAYEKEQRRLAEKERENYQRQFVSLRKQLKLEIEKKLWEE